MIQNLWNAAKAVLRGKFIAIQIKSHKEAYTYTLTKREKGKKKSKVLYF